MDPWLVISYLARLVVESQRAVLDILVTERGLEIQFSPLDDTEFPDEFFDDSE